MLRAAIVIAIATPVGWSVLGGCSFKGGSGSSVVADGGPDSAVEADAQTMPVVGPFTSINPIVGLSDPSFNEDDATMTPDMLELIFVRGPIGDFNASRIHSVTRPSVESQWSVPTQVFEAGFADDGPRLSEDGLTLVFARSDTNATLDLFIATRGELGQPWSTPEKLVGVNSAAHDEKNGFITNDRLRFYFCVDFASGPEQLFFAERADADNGFGSPTPIVLAEDTVHECEAFVFADEKMLLYAVGDATASPLAPRYEIHVATRDSIDERFVNRGSLDLGGSEVADRDPWLSPDSQSLMFSSTRPDGATSQDLYMATRD